MKKEKMNKLKKQREKMVNPDEYDLSYGSQVALISIGAILGILLVISLVVIVFFKDILF